MELGGFIRAHTFWIVPVSTILLTIIIKLCAKPDKAKLRKEDWSDFGFDMSITSVVIIVTYTTDVVGVFLCGLVLAMVIIVTNIVRRIGIGADLKPNWWGIILPDLAGILSLLIAVLFVGGYIK